MGFAGLGDEPLMLAAGLVESAMGEMNGWLRGMNVVLWLGCELAGCGGCLAGMGELGWRG